MWLEFVDDDDYNLPPPYNILELAVSICKKCSQKVCRFEVQTENVLYF